MPSERVKRALGGIVYDDDPLWLKGIAYVVCGAVIGSMLFIYWLIDEIASIITGVFQWIL